MYLWKPITLWAVASLVTIIMVETSPAGVPMLDGHGVCIQKTLLSINMDDRAPKFSYEDVAGAYTQCREDVPEVGDDDLAEASGCYRGGFMVDTSEDSGWFSGKEVFQKYLECFANQK